MCHQVQGSVASVQFNFSLQTAAFQKYYQCQCLSDNLGLLGRIKMTAKTAKYCAQLVQWTRKQTMHGASLHAILALIVPKEKTVSVSVLKFICPARVCHSNFSCAYPRVEQFLSCS